MKKQKNFAFIDSQNLNMSFREMGWKLDYRRFRVYLEEKYHVVKAYIFIGYIESNANLYKSLQEKGYVLIFKPTLKYKDGTVKGNCDAELVLQAMIDYPDYGQAVIVTGDGDFYCLAEYLIQKNKLQKLLIPNQQKYSALLKRVPSGCLGFLSDLKKKVAYKKKEPRKDKP
ncbi:NYN domain-containing protein [Patescibacteria group bacterium]|nr:NYN domain-containing protein [Patescibacteria group bacterium]